MDRELYSFRKEIKYVIPIGKAFAMKEQLDRLMERDSYCKEGPYSVRSLYFDSLNNIDFAEKLSGVRDRKKVRLRIYNGDASLCKLEIKQKNDDRQQKLGFLISQDDAKALACGEYRVLKKYFDTAKTSLKAYSIMAQGQYRPAVQIVYDRLAYKYPLYDTRVTLDMNIRATESNMDLFSSAVHYTPVLQDNVVLEIKYSGKMVGFLSAMLTRFHLTQGTYSKYCAGRRVYYEFNY